MKREAQTAQGPAGNLQELAQGSGEGPTGSHRGSGPGGTSPWRPRVSPGASDAVMFMRVKTKARGEIPCTASMTLTGLLLDGQSCCSTGERGADARVVSEAGCFQSMLFPFPFPFPSRLLAGGWVVERWWKAKNKAKNKLLPGVEKLGVSRRAQTRVVHLART